MKMLKIELEEALHAKFKGWAFGQGTTMAKAARGLIAAEVDFFPVAVEQLDVAKEVGFDSCKPSGSPVAAKVKPEEPLDVATWPGKRMPTEPYIEPAEMKKCAKCFDVFPLETLVPDRQTKKLYCKSCVEDMKNGR